MSRIAIQFRCTTWKMLKVSLSRQARLLAARKHEFTQTVAFFFMAITLFRMSIGLTELSMELIAAISYCSWLFALMLTSSSALEADFARGYLHQFYLTGVALEVPLLAYYAISTLFYLTIWLLSSPLVMLIMDVDYDQYLPFIAAGVLMTLTLNSTLLTCRAMLLGSTPSVLLAILTIPLLLPIVIITMLSIQQLSYMFVLLLLWLGLMPISMITGAYAITTAFDDAL
ncbi:MAG: heme exporter protein CcmB [Proteobacteria bacterium]|nr:heme exporter protein CcmB [Pseudomonadota bacterium]